MVLTLLAVVASGAVLTVLVSAFIAWSSNRSAVCNMALGILLGLAAIGGAVIIAWFLARSVLPR